jgi:gliding motility-associated-like protein
MQKLRNFAFLSLTLLFGLRSYAQTILFQDNFGTGCNSVQQANNVATPSGTWTTTDLIPPTPSSNAWFISATEVGPLAVAPSTCGTDGCNNGANNQTLHLGSVPDFSGLTPCPSGDCGASYNAGLSFLGVDATTAQRAQSPTFSCAATAGTVYIKFKYLKGGDAPVDNCVLEVSTDGGGSWTQFDDPPTTGVCGAFDYGSGIPLDKGTWAFRNIAVPGAAGAASVKIGLLWKNDADDFGVDPSFAIDDIVVIDSVLTVVNPVINITGPTTLCIGQAGTYTATATAGAPINTWTWSALPAGGSATGQANGTTTCTINYSFPTAGTYTIGCLADNGSGAAPPIGSNTIVVTVSANQVPAVSIGPAGPCAAQSVTITPVPTNGGAAPTYQWFVNGTPNSTGATFTTSTLAVGDLVTCTMTSNSACASPTTANSNTLTAVNCSVNPTPSITSATLNGCVNQPISLSGSASPSSGAVSTWAWTSSPATATFSAPAGQNTTFTAATPGSYTVTLTVTPGNAQTTTTLTISATPTVGVTPSADTVCLGGTGTTLIASGASTYSWTPATGLSATTGTVVNANPTSNTTYIVTGTTNGCSSTASSQITALVVSPVVATALSNYVCLGSTTSITTSAPAALSYSWTPSTGLSCTNCGNPIVTASDTTIYTVTVTGQCFSNTSDTVIIYGVVCGPPVAGFVPSDTVICRYSCITYTDTSKFAPLQYQWYFQGGVPDSSHEQNPTVCYPVESANSPAGNGMYYVTLIVTNLQGDKDTMIDSIKVDISPIANINNNQTYTTIELGTSTTLNATYSSGALYYSWIPSVGMECPSCSVIEVSPQQNTVYVVKATNGFGCYDYDTILVRVEKICGDVFVPTAFSPNGDNINDHALVKNNNCIRSLVFSIFDRWGEKVFYTEDPKSIGWDGTYKGKAMDAGVFVFYVDAVLSDNTTVSQKGNITLVR